MKTDYDLVGIGIGPFNLSLAALLHKTPDLKARFFEQKPGFSWHSELMFRDSIMQTSFLKDLVTPVDPTNPHSFLNYLVQHGLFYAHLNTNRGSVSRREFEHYCKWVCEKLGDKVNFGAAVSAVAFKDGAFVIRTPQGECRARHISIGTGLTPWIPDFARHHVGPAVLHAKSKELASLNMTGKRVVVVGGGQTGLEVFRNAFNGRWGEARSVRIISRRHNLEPLDESPFTNEYFSPSYVKEFFDIQPGTKPAIVQHQRFASDGNTPSYLLDLYQELYQIKHVEGDKRDIRILPQRRLIGLTVSGEGKKLTIENLFSGGVEHMEADIVVLATGFRSTIPACLDPLLERIKLDTEGRLQLGSDYQLEWEHKSTNHIYAMNFARHSHGIAEPQTSLMAWRSAKIINHLNGKDVYQTLNAAENFTQHGTFHEP